MINDTSTIVKEILEYCEQVGNYSYYDMKTYAIKEQPEWMEALHNRNFARIIASLLKGRMKETVLQYQSTYGDAFDNYLQAVIDKEQSD